LVVRFINVGKDSILVDIDRAVREANETKGRIEIDLDTSKLISKRSLMRTHRDILTYGEVAQIAAGMKDPMYFLGRIAKDMNFPFKLDYRSDVAKKALDEAHLDLPNSIVYVSCRNPHVVAEKLNQAGIDASTSIMGISIEIDALDFYLNSKELIDVLPKYAAVHSFDPDNESKTKNKMQQAKDLLDRYLTFQKLSFSGIRPLHAMNAEQEFRYEDGTDPVIKYFLENSVPFTWRTLEEHMPMGNIRRSEELFLERLKELAPDVQSAEAGRALLSNLSPVDTIVMGSLFARAAIDEYANDKDQMRLLSTGRTQDALYGSCRHYSGIALQLIRRMIQPNNPRLKDWFFGIHTTHIDDYKHGEIVIAHHYKSKGKDRIGVCFADPTKLVGDAKQLYNGSKDFDLKRLDSTADKYHFFRIIRTGEDFIAAPFDLKHKGNRSHADVMDAKIEGR